MGTTRGNATALRSFDPRRVGELESATWAAYCRRDWARVLPLSVQLVRGVFGLPWPQTLLGAAHVARATRAWAPVPARTEEATAHMRRFYALVVRTHGENIDPDEAAHLEVDWWRIHRERARNDENYEAVTHAIARKYAYIYGVSEDTVREAGEARALAMRLSDQQGPTQEVTNALIRSYTFLRHAAGEGASS